MRKFNSVFLLTTLAAILVIAGCARSRLALGERLESTGRYNDALSAYQAALAQFGPHQRHELSVTYYRMGECLLRLRRMPEAFHAFQMAADVDSTNADAHLRMGEFMVSAGLAEGARNEAETAMRIHPHDSEAIALLAAALEKMGDKEGAKREFERSMSINPKRPSVAIALADLYNGDDQIKQAREVLENSVKENPHAAAPLLALGRLHEQEGEIGDAELSYRAAVKAEDTRETNLRLAQFLQRTSRIAEAEQVLRRVDSLEAGKTTALADFELIAGRASNASHGYEATLNTDKRDKQKQSADQEDRGRVATRLVEADLQMADADSGNNVAAAVQRAREHLKQYKADVDAATSDILEAEIALAENDLPIASQKADEAVVLAPTSAPALYTHGLVRSRCSDPAAAQDDWLKALDEDSHFAPARLALAEQSLAAGDAAGAETYVLPVVRDEPANVRALELFTRALAGKGMFAAAATIAHRMEALTPKSAQPYILLGEIALRADRRGEALIDYERAVIMDPHSPQAVEGLTKVYETGRITRPMLLQIERVASNQPKSAVLMEIAGRLFAENHWYADARRCLTEALQIDPQRATAAAALADTLVKTGDLPAAAESAARTGGNAAALLAGVKAQEKNDVRGAIDDYERAVRGGETTGVAANNLAWLYAEQGANLGRALALAQAAESLSPGNPAVLDTMGVVRLRRREYSEAIRTLEAARQLSERSQPQPQLLAQIRQHLAEAYLKAGNTEKAKSVDLPTTHSR